METKVFLDSQDAQRLIHSSKRWIILGPLAIRVSRETKAHRVNLDFLLSEQDPLEARDVQVKWALQVPKDHGVIISRGPLEVEADQETQASKD